MNDRLAKPTTGQSGETVRGETVTEWAVMSDDGTVYPHQDRFAAPPHTEETARRYADVNLCGRIVVSRTRTSYPDVVTNWQGIAASQQPGGRDE